MMLIVACVFTSVTPGVLEVSVAKKVFDSPAMLLLFKIGTDTGSVVVASLLG